MLASQLVTVRNHLGLLFNWGAKKKKVQRAQADVTSVRAKHVQRLQLRTKMCKSDGLAPSARRVRRFSWSLTLAVFFFFHVFPLPTLGVKRDCECHARAYPLAW